MIYVRLLLLYRHVQHEPLPLRRDAQGRIPQGKAMHHYGKRKGELTKQQPGRVLAFVVAVAAVVSGTVAGAGAVDDAVPVTPLLLVLTCARLL